MVFCKVFLVYGHTMELTVHGPKNLIIRLSGQDGFELHPIIDYDLRFDSRKA